MKLWLFFAFLLFSLSFASLVSAQAGQVYFNEEFNYSSLDQMQAAGWTFTRPAGISVSSSAVTLDGTGGDCAMSRAASFSSAVYDWKAEVRCMWLGQGHSVLSVFVYTEGHSYGWAADGYYKEFSFYRDSQKVLHFGNYAEKSGEYVVLTMVREGNTFSFYFNGNLINTYTEEDTAPSKVTNLALVSPWRGDAKYDYYMLSEPTAVMPSTQPTQESAFPTNTVLIGGGIAALVVGGIVVYYFLIAGGSAGASSGSAAAGGTGGVQGSGEGGSIIEEQQPSPLMGETPQPPGIIGAQPPLVYPSQSPVGSVSVGSSVSQPTLGPSQTPVGPGSQTPVGSVSVGSSVSQPTLGPSQTPVEPGSQTPTGSSSVDSSVGQTAVGTAQASVGSSVSQTPAGNAPTPQGYTPLVTITGTDFGSARSVNLTKTQTGSKTGQTEESSESK